MGEERVSRPERRRRTEAAILAAARRRFAEHGFERTTVRAVAGDAGVDPALVMQHFGSKERLFAAAARWSVDTDPLVTADRARLAAAALEHVLAEFEDGEGRRQAVALLRSSLTHPAAREVLLRDVVGPAQAAVAQTIGGDDAALRAAVLNACTLGLAIARHLLEVPALTGADRAAIERVLGPALDLIVDPARTVDAAEQEPTP